MTLNSHVCQEVYIAELFPHIQRSFTGFRVDEVALVGLPPPSRCQLSQLLDLYLKFIPASTGCLISQF